MRCIAEDWRCNGQGMRCIVEDWRCITEDWWCTGQGWRSLQRNRCTTDRTCGVRERSIHVPPPFGACRHTCCGATTCSKGAHTPNWTVFVRTMSHWEKLFTPYRAVELSPRVEFWCLYVISINGVVQILTFPGINNNRILDLLWGFYYVKY